MNKIYFFPIFILTARLAICQNQFFGYWTGTMIRENSILAVSFEFKEQNKKISGFFNADSQKASGIPIDSLVSLNDTLHFQLMSEPVTIFTSIFKNNHIEGQFLQDGLSKGTILLNQALKPEVQYTYIDSIFLSGKNKIAC